MTKPTKILFGLLASCLALMACERPPVDATQIGYRGTAMVDVQNSRDPMGAMQYPAALPAAPSAGRGLSAHRARMADGG